MNLSQYYVKEEKPHPQQVEEMIAALDLARDSYEEGKGVRTYLGQGKCWVMQGLSKVNVNKPPKTTHLSPPALIHPAVSYFKIRFCFAPPPQSLNFCATCAKQTD